MAKTKAPSPKERRLKRADRRFRRAEAERLKLEPVAPPPPVAKPRPAPRPKPDFQLPRMKK